MVAKKKKPDKKGADTSGSTRSLRDNAEKQLSRTQKHSPDIAGQTREELIHALQVHQIELETQAEELKKAKLEAEESRDGYIALYDFAPVGYLTLTDKALVKEMNLTGARLLGDVRSKLIQALFRKFIAPKDHALWSQHFMNVLNKGEPQSFDLELVQSDGSAFPARLDCIRIDKEGEPPAVRIAFSDIADIHTKEETLLRQTATLSILNDIILTANQADNLPELLNNILTESLHLLDFDAGGIYLVDRSTRTANIVHSRNLPSKFAAAIQTVPIDKKPYDTLFIKNESLISNNYDKISPDQSRMSGFLSLASIPLISKGVTIGALNIASTKRYEISEVEKQTLVSISRELGSTIERMAAEEEGKTAKNNLETLFNSIDEMVFVLDMQGHILTVNNTVLKRLSYTPEELTGTDVLLLHVPERRNEALRIVQGMIAGTMDSCPVPVLAKDGTRIEVETKITRGWWNGKEVLIGVTRDVTERKRAEDALLENEERLRTILHSMQTGIIVIDADTHTILDANQKSFEMIGETKEKILGSVCHSYICPAEMGNCPITDLAQTIDNSERVLISAQGKKIPILKSVIPTILGGKQVLVESFIDITEHKRAENALRQLTDRLALATRAGGVGIWDLDVVNNNLTWDDQMFALYGIRREQFGGAYEAWQAGLHPDDRKQADAEVQKALRKENEFDTEFRIIWPDGSIRNIRALGLVQRDAAGKPLRMIGTNWDITAQKKAEEEITRQASMIKSLLDSIPDIIFFKDIKGVYLGCNPPFAEFVGKSREEIINKTDYDLFDKEIADFFRENDKRMLELGKFRHNEEWITYPDGRKILIDTLKTPYWGPDGTLIGVLGISRDITDRKRAEDALQQANKQLNLLSSITRHDILNQLMALKGYLYLSKERIDDPKALAEYLQKEDLVADAIERQIKFTKDYQDLGVAAPEWQSVNASIKKAVSSLPMRGVHVEAGPKIPEIFVDLLFEKVFYNLIDNALRYGGADMKTIRVSSQESDGKLTIVCEDDGVGISAGDKKKLFTRGFGKNTGLGLFLSREILAITGITIIENGETGKGARFEITVPKGAWRMTGDGA